MEKYIFHLLIILLLTNCNSKNIELVERPAFERISSGDHNLYTKTIGQGDVTILFESGLGEAYGSWIASDLVESLKNDVKMIMYSRAGIGMSDQTESSASIENMIIDLDSVITTLADGEKLILVGHSLGGAIIRAYSVEYPEKISGLVFIEPSHEYGFSDLTEEEQKEAELEFLSYDFNDINSSITKEKKDFFNTLRYLDTLDNLPDIPVILLTSVEQSDDPIIKNYWTNISNCLSEGLYDFKHIKVDDSGHHIQRDQPEIVKSAILKIIKKVHKKEGFLSWIYNTSSK